MKERNVLGSSKGYVERVVDSYAAVTINNARKYFLSTLKFMRLYQEGETGYTVNKKMEQMRKAKKCHRGAVVLKVDHSKKDYPRDRNSI